VNVERTELDVLLFRHRLTFNWSDPTGKWWLVGQVKGGNSLALRKQPHWHSSKIFTNNFPAYTPDGKSQPAQVGFSYPSITSISFIPVRFLMSRDSK
jgi:hypothetical protein